LNNRIIEEKKGWGLLVNHPVYDINLIYTYHVSSQNTRPQFRMSSDYESYIYIYYKLDWLDGFENAFPERYPCDECRIILLYYWFLKGAERVFWRRLRFVMKTACFIRIVCIHFFRENNFHTPSGRKTNGCFWKQGNSLYGLCCVRWTEVKYYSE